MTAVLSFLSTFAVFIYIGCVVVILFGIKMLFDARRAGRTTLFTLEQEQASDRAFRALLVMVLGVVVIIAVASINMYSSSTPIPTPEVAVQPTVPAFTPPVFVGTATPRPTSTPIPTTPAPTDPPVKPTTAAVVVTPTLNPNQPTAAPVEPTAPPEPTQGTLVYPAPPLNNPPNGDSIGSDNIRLGWGHSGDNLDVPEVLPLDQFYRISITYVQRSTNASRTRVFCTHEISLDRRTGLDVSDYRTDAVDSMFQWNVTIVQAPSQQVCEGNTGWTALSPQSATFGFKLP